MRQRPNHSSSSLAFTVLLAKCLAAGVIGVYAVRADQLALTLTYNGLGVATGEGVPKPYPGISAAVVTHSAISNGVPVPDVFFWGEMGPMRGYGNLTNVAVGPHGANVFAGVIISPSFASNHVRLISFDLATKHDGLGDLGFHIYVQDTDNTILRSLYVDVAGDVNGSTHTHVNFGGIPVAGPVNKGLAIYWPASNGRVAIDNVRFEILGPMPSLARAGFGVVAKGGALELSAPGVPSNDLAGGDSGPLTAGSVNASSPRTLNSTSNKSTPSLHSATNRSIPVEHLALGEQVNFKSELNWRPTIGDPTFMGWFTVVAYVVGGGLAAWAALCGGRAGDSGRNSKRRRCWMWLAVAALMLCLCINKQLDFQSLLTDIGRVIARHHGWYGQRRSIQMWFVLGVIVGAVVLGSWFIWRFQEFWRRHKLLTSGLFFLLTFLVVRAISFHHVEALMDNRVLGFKMNWALELMGILLVGLAAARECAGKFTCR